MKTYIVLLRGINVGGRNRLPMAQLVELLEKVGLRNIKTYIQSGNIVFQSDEVLPADLAERVEAAIHKQYGFKPYLFLLEMNEFDEAIASNPFPEAESFPKALHLFFLDSPPEDLDLKALESIRRENEQFALRGQVFYLYAPDGIGRSKLAARVEKLLGVTVTARNWRSVRAIHALAKQGES